MHFVNDGVFDTPVQRYVTFPIVVCGVNDDGAQRSRNVIRIIAGIDTFPERLGVSPRIRVDKDLITVVTEASFGHGRATHAKGIIRTGFQIFHKNVPEVKCFVPGGDQGDYLKGCGESCLSKRSSSTPVA